MWQSDNDKPEKKKKLLPPSRRAGTYFGDLSQHWQPVVRPVVEEEEPAAPIDDENLPAYLRHRPTGRQQKLHFRTKAAVRTKRPKR